MKLCPERIRWKACFSINTDALMMHGLTFLNPLNQGKSFSKVEFYKCNFFNFDVTRRIAALKPF